MYSPYISVNRYTNLVKTSLFRRNIVQGAAYISYRAVVNNGVWASVLCSSNEDQAWQCLQIKLGHIRQTLTCRSRRDLSSWKCLEIKIFDRRYMLYIHTTLNSPALNSIGALPFRPPPRSSGLQTSRPLSRPWKASFWRCNDASIVSLERQLPRIPRCVSSGGIVTVREV